MEIKYEDYQRLICKLANTYSKITGIEAEELISIGNLEFVLCLESYDPQKAKFSTYLTWKLKGRFLEEGRKHRSRKQFVDYEPTASGLQEEILFFKDILRELSSDAREVVKIVFNTPVELIDMLPKKQPRGINKHQLQRHLHRQGWSFPRIWKTFEEIARSL